MHRSTRRASAFFALALSLSTSPVRAEEIVRLLGGDTSRPQATAPIPAPSGASSAGPAVGSGGGSVVGALGRVARNTFGSAVRSRALVAESVGRAGLSLVELPPLSTMEQNARTAGRGLFGEQRMEGMWDAYRQNQARQRSQVIREHGRLGALGIWGQTRKRQPASWWYDTFARDKVLRRINNIGRWR